MGCVGRCVKAVEVPPQQGASLVGIRAVFGDFLQHLHQVFLAAQAFGIGALWVKRGLGDKSEQGRFLRFIQSAVERFCA
ncbi:hypothetical protein D3C85_1851620 [compost metagenome]